MKTKVSIILPTYNGGKYIRQAIESILSQTFFEWELIIVNDGSSDDSEMIISKYAKKDSRIIYLKNENNLGIQKSLNKGLREARGEYIARIDDDDEWIDKEKLHKQIEFLEKNKDYILVGTNGLVKDENKNIIVNYNVPEDDSSIKKSILLKNPFIQSSVVVRKEYFLEIGGYNEEEFSKNVEDYELWLRLGSSGKFFNLKGRMTSYMLRDGNISLNNKKDILKKNIYLINKYKCAYSNYKKALLFAYVKFFVYSAIYLIKNKKLRDKITIFIFRKYRKISF